MNIVKKLLVVLLIVPGINRATPGYQSQGYQVPNEESTFAFPRISWPSLPAIKWPTINFDQVKEFISQPETMIGISVCIAGLALYGFYKKYFKKSDGPAKKPSTKPQTTVKPATQTNNRPVTDPAETLETPTSKVTYTTIKQQKAELRNSNVAGSPKLIVLGEGKHRDINVYQREVSYQEEAATCAPHAIRNALSTITGSDIYNRALFEKNLESWRNVALAMRKTAAIKNELKTILISQIVSSDQEELYEYLRQIMIQIAFEISNWIINIEPEKDFHETTGYFAERIKLLIKETAPSELLSTLIASKYNIELEDEQSIQNFLCDNLEQFIPGIYQFNYAIMHHTIGSIYQRHIALEDQAGEWLEVNEIRKIIEKLNKKNSGLQNIITCFNNGELSLIGLYESATAFRTSWNDGTDCQHIFLYNSADAIASYNNATVARGHWYAIIAKIDQGFKSILILDSVNTDRTGSPEVKAIIDFLES